ncbi:hypothetical protein [Nocardia brasiliensis]|uniref:hypothetical protein n=1 Tax=Nocardia brasiliensis TaxID=37326 RepID=UPI003D8FD6C2
MERTTRLRTVLRRVVLGAFACTVAAIAVLVGEVMLSVTGVLFDPHGYAMFGGILFAAVLTPIALLLWLLYVMMRREQ